MPPAGFETAIPASQRPQTHALDRVVTNSMIAITKTGIAVNNWCKVTTLKARCFLKASKTETSGSSNKIVKDIFLVTAKQVKEVFQHFKTERCLNHIYVKLHFLLHTEYSLFPLDRTNGKCSTGILIQRIQRIIQHVSLNILSSEVQFLNDTGLV